MNPVLDNVKMTSPGKISARRFGLSSDVPLAGGTWVAEHSAGTIEAVATHAALNELSSYQAITPESRWELDVTETGFVVSDTLTGIFGSGKEPIEAIRDLASALAEHRDVLERQGDLSPGLQDQLRYLRELI